MATSTLTIRVETILNVQHPKSQITTGSICPR